MNITKFELLQVTEDEKRRIYENYNKDESKIRRHVEIIKNWLVKQPHLPEDISGKYLTLANYLISLFNS